MTERMWKHGERTSKTGDEQHDCALQRQAHRVIISKKKSTAMFVWNRPSGYISAGRMATIATLAAR